MDAAADTIGEIERLGQLEPDWDSYGAEPIERSALDRAKQFVRAIDEFASRASVKLIAPEVGPAPDAGVALLWPSQRLGEVEVRFSPYGDWYAVIQNRKQLGWGPIVWTCPHREFHDRKQVTQGPVDWDRGFLKLFIDYFRP